MRYFWTFFWTFLLVQMLNYVVSAMSGTTFNFVTGTILAVIVTVLLFVVSLIIPNDPVENHGAH
ncbi:MAG TPA: YjzD family protein [Pseudoneobacillus sp.]|nr:YjzD family protein [Pseudoneobacillus sp.]